MWHNPVMAGAHGASRLSSIRSECSPRLLSLENGVTVLSFGRPGVHLLFTRDGAKWEGLHTLIAEKKRQTRTSGYTGLIAVGPDRFLIAYDQFDYPNEEGQPRKTILVREVQVSATPQR